MSFSFLHILAGVALILFGSRYLRKGFDRLVGHHLVHWLHQMTAHRLRAFVAGIGIATLAPSSTTLALVTVRMLQTGNLTADRMLAVFLGANIGMTVIVQMLAFKITDIYGLFLVSGVFAFQFLKRAVLRGIGQILLALGFVFLGISLISQAAAAIPTDGAFSQILQILLDKPLMLFVASAIMSLLLQSTTATIGLGLALVQGGIGGLEFLLPLVLGANFGVALTALIAGWRSTEGRRLGGANLLLKGGVTVVLFLSFDLLLKWWGMTPGEVPRQAANFHTGFNVLVALVGLPLVNPVYRFVAGFLVPDEEDDEEARARRRNFLDEAALDSPSMALANATRQTLLMASEVKVMLESYWACFTAGDSAGAREVQVMDNQIDTWNNEITNYLARLNEGSMGPKDSKLQLALLNFTSELEAVGDIIDRNLSHQVIKQEIAGDKLSADDLDRLKTYYEMVSARFELAINILATRNKELAEEILDGKDMAKDLYLQHQGAHYRELRQGNLSAIYGSSYFLDMLNSLRRISGHLTSIGYHFDGRSKKKEEEVSNPTKRGDS